MLKKYSLTSYRSKGNKIRHLSMISGWFLIVLLLSLSSFAGDGIDRLVLANYLETNGDQFYHTKEIPGNLKLALKQYKKALKYRAEKSDIEWKIVRCYWVLAQKTSNERELNLYHKEGIRYGKAAVKNNSENSNAHLWYAMIVGSGAMRQGVVRTLYNREIIKSGLEKAISLNPRNTNAYVGLAGWYFYVPAILGGDKSEALRLINKAIKLEPNYTSARLVKAEFLISEESYDKATRELNLLLAVKKPVIRGDGVEDKRKAAELLAELKEIRKNG